jgi:hypothetical protein
MEAVTCGDVDGRSKFVFEVLLDANEVEEREPLAGAVFNEEIEVAAGLGATSRCRAEKIE